MNSGMQNFIVRKVGVRKDNRAVVYLPLDYIVSEWVKVQKEGERIVIEPIE